MINIITLENALYNWVYGISGITTIFAHPNAPRPATPYVLINLVQFTPLGVAEIQYTDTDGVITAEYANVESLFVSINAYKTGAFQTAINLKNSLDRITIAETLFAAGLGYLNATAVNDIPEIVNKQWEQRGQFDCFFAVRSTDDTETVIGNIEKIQITNEINGTSKIIE